MRLRLVEDPKRPDAHDAVGEVHRWRVGGVPFIIRVWTDRQIACLPAPPPDARHFASAGIWVAFRNI